VQSTITAARQAHASAGVFAKEKRSRSGIAAITMRTAP
jgi:hypothetical protein